MIWGVEVGMVDDASSKKLKKSGLFLPNNRVPIPARNLGGFLKS